MNTTDNKTSLYELVTKRDRLKVMDEVEDVKDKLDTIPRGEILTAYNQFGEVSKIFIYNSKAVGSDYFNTLLTCYPYAGQLTKNHTFHLNDIDKLSFATSLQKEILFEQMMKEGYIWNGQNVVKDESTEKEDEISIDDVKKINKIEDDNKITFSKLKTLSCGEILTAYNKIGQIESIFIYNGKPLECGLFNTLWAYFPMFDSLRTNSILNFDDFDKITFSTPEEKENLRTVMKRDGYIWDGLVVKKVEPTEEKPSTNGDKNILDKAIENKIAHNIKVAKDILDNTLPYYVINDNIEPLAIKTDKSLKRDLNNFNYFTNKEDVDEAIRRVKETLMNFQEEIQNRDK